MDAWSFYFGAALMKHVRRRCSAGVGKLEGTTAMVKSAVFTRRCSMVDMCGEEQEQYETERRRL